MVNAWFERFHNELKAYVWRLLTWINMHAKQQHLTASLLLGRKESRERSSSLLSALPSSSRLTSLLPRSLTSLDLAHIFDLLL